MGNQWFLTVEKHPGERCIDSYAGSHLRGIRRYVGKRLMMVQLKDTLWLICGAESTGLGYNCSIDGQHYSGAIFFVGFENGCITSCPLSAREIEKLYPDLAKTR